MEAVVGTSRLAAQRESRDATAAATWFHSHGRIWVPFPEVDNIALEEAYMRVHDQLADRRATQTTSTSEAPPARWWLGSSFWSSRQDENTSMLPPPPPPAPPDKHALPSYRATDPDEPAEERQFRVAVLEDRLFDVDLTQMIVRAHFTLTQMYPALWAGYDQHVIRAHWYYVASDGATSPIGCDTLLESDILQAYHTAEPWRLSQRLKGTLSKSRGEEVPLYDLPSVVGGAKIHFEAPHTARIVTQHLGSKLFPFSRDAYLVRGLAHARELSERLSSGAAWQRRGDSPSKRTPTASPAMQAADAPAAEAPSPPGVSSQPEKSGPAAGTIGERTVPSDPTVSPTPWVALSEAFLSKAWSFRRTSAPQPDDTDDESATSGSDVDDRYDDDTSMPSTSSHPPELLFCIHGIGQKLFEDYATQHFVHDIDRLRTLMRTQMQDADLRPLLNGGRVKLIPICWRRGLQFDPDVGYTLQDLTNDATIPAVRNVVTKALLDVPFYFSRHHGTMKQAVLLEMNRLYRLFVQRNPEFEQRGGRVSIMGHSLGSMLAADLLKMQPTFVPPLREIEEARIHTTSPHLLFNTRYLFCTGSPLPFLFYMNGAQLRARRRPGNEAEDATSDVIGQDGCLAVEAIYNVYASTDPVSFQMSATADPAYARVMRPVDLPRDALHLPDALDTPRLNMSKLLQRVVRERTDDLASPEIRATSQPGTPLTVPIPLEEMERGERRFRALNPNGCIDYVMDVNWPSSVRAEAVH